MDKIRSYYIAKGFEWAKIYLEGGLVTVHSSFGLFGAIFCFDGDAREFLSQCNCDYLIKKMNDRPKEIDFEATEEVAKSLVCSARRKKHIQKDEAREAFYSISFDSEFDITCWLDDHCQVWYDEGSDFVVTKYCQQLLSFFEILWPKFIDQIKTELLAEPARIEHS